MDQAKLPEPKAAPDIVLASRSPRRSELLGRLGLDFEVQPAEIDESYLGHEMPADHAERLAREKALAVARDRPDALVIGSDTIVVIDSDVLGKPADDEEAVAMLGRLSGRRHEVYTAVAAVQGHRLESGIERVEVTFRALTTREIREYVATREPMDKAGGYGIQGFGSAIVESIRGDYFAVMGLPVVRLLDLLHRLGWRYAFGRLEPRPEERSS